MYNYYNLLSCTKTEVSKETPRMNSQFFLTKMENRKKKKKKKKLPVFVLTQKENLVSFWTNYSEKFLDKTENAFQDGH